MRRLRPPAATRKYDVGYAKPPEHSRFKKGASGNPSGRPKGAKTRIHAPGTSLDGLVLAEAFRTVIIRENDQQFEMPLMQAALRSLGVGAVKGNHRAQAQLATLVGLAQERDYKLKMDYFEALASYKIDWDEELQNCDRAGRPRPEIVPHPDDLQIDTSNGRVLINGPFDDVEKARWDKAAQERANWQKDLDWATKEKRRKGASHRVLDDHIAHSRRMIDLINLSYPDEETRRPIGFDLQEWRKRRLKDLGLERRAAQSTKRLSSGKGPS